MYKIKKMSLSLYVFMHIKIHVILLIDKPTLSLKSGLQSWCCLFMFRCITLTQLNSLTPIDTFSCRGGQDVTHQSATSDFLKSLINECFN